MGLHRADGKAVPLTANSKVQQGLEVLSMNPPSRQVPGLLGLRRVSKLLGCGTVSAWSCLTAMGDSGSPGACKMWPVLGKPGEGSWWPDPEQLSRVWGSRNQHSDAVLQPLSSSLLQVPGPTGHVTRSWGLNSFFFGSWSSLLCAAAGHLGTA